MPTPASPNGHAALDRGPRERTSAWLAEASQRLAVVPRRRATPIVLAALLFVLTATLGSGRLYAGVSPVQLQVIAFVSLGLAWLLVDRLLALRLPPVTAAGAVAVIAVLACAAWLRFHGLHIGHDVALTLLLGWICGALVRGFTPGCRSLASLVPMAAVASWLGFDAVTLLYQPLRDIRLYLGAGATILSGSSPYLQEPVTKVADPTKLPFVYPPLTAPLFAALASIPAPLAEGLWVAVSIVAVTAAFWLLGIRGRWLILMLAWPATAQGIAVGNVASFTFFCYALGFKVGAAIILSGLFKVQSAIPALWLLRERRWGSIVVGGAGALVLALVALPIMGAHAWIDWAIGLRYFQGSFAAFPGIEGFSLDAWLGPLAAAAIAVLAVLFALRGRGRVGLARLGIASIIASPTLYLHGLSPILPAALALGPEVLWFVLGLAVWTRDPVWLAVALVAVSLTRAGRDLALPEDLSPARSDIHPAARSGQVWPIGGGPSRQRDSL